MLCLVIGGSMFGSLRSKLVFSHFIVILTALLLTAAIASVPIRRAQEARLRASLATSSEAIARQIDLTRTLASDADLVRDTTQLEFARRMITAEQQRSGNRILVVDADGRVILDSSPTRSYEDQRLPSVTSAIEELNQRIGSAPPPPRIVSRFALVLETYAVSAGTLEGRRATIAATGANALPERDKLYAVAWAPQSAAPLIDDFVRPLAFASVVALLVAVVVGLLISRSVTGPLERLTESVGGISGTGLDEPVALATGGEVGTLVTAFNRMLARLSSTYRSQRELLANIAHELRTPLTSIQGYAQALRDGVIQEERARDDALATIADEARRMTTLVEQILQLSRLESGQLPVHFSETSLGEVLERVERQFAPLTAEREVELIVDREADLRASVDPELLIQALGNLTHNAIRHTPAGGSVELRASRVSTPTGPTGVRITVRDTGEGMSDEELTRVFERFYRSGDRSQQLDTRHFGLGLSIVQEIVSRHNGRISIESTPGVGTTFTIDLPSHPDEPATPTD